MNIIKEMLNTPDTPSGKKKLNKLITKLGLGKKQKGDILKNVVNGDIGGGKQIFDYIYFRNYYFDTGNGITLPMYDMLEHIFKNVIGVQNAIYINERCLVHFRANNDAKFEKIIASNDTHQFDENYIIGSTFYVPYYIGVPKYIFKTPIDKIDVLEYLKMHETELYNELIQVKVDEKDVYNNNFKMYYYTIQNNIDFINEFKNLTSDPMTISNLLNPAFIGYRLLYGYDTYHYNELMTIDPTTDFSLKEISLIAYTDINLPKASDLPQIYFGSPIEAISKYIEFYNNDNNEEFANYLEGWLNIFKKYFVELSEEEYFRILTENCKS